jgi:signal transduction histidine kinase
VAIGLPLALRPPPADAGPAEAAAPRPERLVAALVAIGSLWSLTALGQTSASVPYTVGRISAWLVFPCVAYLLLAFPDGRIANGVDRLVLAGIVGLLAALFVGTAPLAEAFPIGTLWATCTDDCPANAVFALDRQPDVLDELVLVRAWLVALLWLGVFASMHRRWRVASHLRRRALAPVLAAGAALGVLQIAHIAARQLGAPADLVIALSSAWTVAIVAVCGAFLVALVRRRTLIAASLLDLSGALHADPSPARVREALAGALGDPSVELLLRDPDAGGWRDASGRAVAWPAALPAGRAARLLPASGAPASVALIHDEALADDPELLDGVAGMILAAWRHERVTADLARAMSDLRSSRRRIAEAAQLERARIERDLHDGAQQRLVALRMRLTLAQELMHQDAERAAGAIRDISDEVAVALDEIRSLAQGIYPALLADRGLPDALRGVALRAPLVVSVDADGVTRHRAEIESAVYYTCLEALQNAAKHGRDATRAHISLRESEVLAFAVSDDGSGFDPSTARQGAGLRNMRDRVEALGGTLSVASWPGRGTTVRGTIPLRDQAATSAPLVPVDAGGAPAAG